jgi:hypothetical protein
MDSNSENAIYHLMQNVIDKLDTIENNIHQKEKDKYFKISFDSMGELQTFIEDFFKEQLDLFKNSNEGLFINLNSSLEKNKTPPSINNYKEYSIFGNQSNFNPKQLIYLVIGITILWFSFKFLPIYYIEHSTLKKEKLVFQTYYEYTFLKQFSKSDKISAEEVYTKIKNNDTIIMNEYKMLLKEFSKEIKKRELERQLKNLEK